MMEKLSWLKFLELLKKGYNLDNLYILSNIENVDLKDFDNPKVAIIYQGMIRKGLLTEEGKVTVEGQLILDFLSKEEETKIVKKKVKEEEFDKWWEIYPKNDSFTYRGKSFTGSRGIRVKKEDCKTKIKAILNEGKYSINDLIRALEYEVFLKKEKSFKEGKNNLTFMQNSLTYLNQGTYHNFMEISKNWKSKETVNDQFDGINI